MALGRRKHRERQEALWYDSELAEAPGHPFYRKLDQLRILPKSITHSPLKAISNLQ
jgi:hypothetical protein